MTKKLIGILCVLLISENVLAQELTATEIIKKVRNNQQGESLYSEVTMTIVRPTWTREVGIKNWTKGENFSLILITSPAKDKGQAFLKRGKDLWNWMPSIDRMVKMSSSVMGQSWMGSDFTNDDMTKHTSKVEDYTHEREKDEVVRESDLSSSLAEGSWNRLMDNLLRTQVGHLEIHQKGYWENKSIDNYMTMERGMIENLRTLPYVTNVSPRVEIFAMASSDEKIKGVGIIGVDPEQENNKSSLGQRVVKGNYLRQDDDGVLLGKGLCDYLQVEVGDSIALMGQGYHGTNAIGLFPIRGVVSMIIPEMNKGFLYMTQPAAQAFVNMPDGYSGILISIDKDDHQETVREELAVTVDMETFEVLRWQESMASLLNQSRANLVFRSMIMFILYVIVGFGIMGTVIMMTNERKHEFGVVVALGMKRQMLANIVSLELFFITILGALLAITVCLPITCYFEHHPFQLTGELARIALGYGMEPSIPMSTNANIYISQAVIILVITSLTISYPIIKILQLKVNKAIRP